jgi:aspartate/methionine/tyrosine aminotransferase
MFGECRRNEEKGLQTRGRNADRLKNIPPSGIRRLFALAQDSPDVVNLGIGEPDFLPPQHVVEAAQRAISDGKTHYTPSTGISALREALAQKYTRDYGLFYHPDTEVLVTVGATEAVFLALLAFVNPGDEVLVPDPGFVCYKPAVLLAGGVPVAMPLREADGFKPDVTAVTSLVTKKSRVMIVNSPNNPTGAVLTYEESAALAKLAVEHDLLVISDEVYEKILYDDATHYCLASLPGMRDRTVVVNSFSKTYAMTGFRVGFALGPADLLSSMTLAHQFTVACVDGPAQYAATAALEGPQASVATMVAEFDRRRRLVHARLREVAGVRCALPRGAFYAFPNVEAFGMSSEACSQFLLAQAKVAVTPGSSFGGYGEGFVRLSFSAAYDQIDEALDRVAAAAKRVRRA